MPINYVDVFASSLLSLYEAEKQLLTATLPFVPIGRFRTFVVLPQKCIWPAAYTHDATTTGLGFSIYQTSGTATRVLYNNKDTRNQLSAWLVSVCDKRPKQLMHTLNIMDRITDWCAKRAKGRARAAQEVIKQQAKARQAIDEIAALMALGYDHTKKKS